jgi:hypothetical protein
MRLLSSSPDHSSGHAASSGLSLSGAWWFTCTIELVRRHGVAGRADDGSWVLVDVRCLSGVSSFPHRTRLHVRRDVGSGKAETGDTTKATHHSCRITTGAHW